MHHQVCGWAIPPILKPRAEVWFRGIDAKRTEAEQAEGKRLYYMIGPIGAAKAEELKRRG